MLCDSRSSQTAGDLRVGGSLWTGGFRDGQYDVVFALTVTEQVEGCEEEW